MQKTRQLELHDATVRAADTGPAYIDGVAVPYDVPINYAGQVERFAPDSIDAQAVIGRPLLYGHNYSDPAAWLGTIVDAENTPSGLLISAEVIEHGMARKLRDATRPPGLSVGVQIDAATMNDDSSVTYTAATLRELSITTVPAYGDDSMIAAVRHQQSEEDTPMPTTEAHETREVAVDLTPLTDRLDQLEARMHTATTPAPRVSVRDAFALGLADWAKTRQTRALADVVSSGNAGILPEQWVGEVLGQIDGMRYLLPRVGRIGFPASGYTLTVPRITQHTLVAARGTEKTQVPSQALTTTSDTFTAAWYAGAVDVAIELIEQSDPAVWNLIVTDLLRQYAVATEEAFATAAEGAATAAGAALDVSDYPTFVGELIAVAGTVRSATGSGQIKLGLKTSDWAAVLGMVDADGRRVLATQGSSNADGSSSLVAESVSIGGVEVFHSPYSTVSLAFNEQSLRVAEKPPMQLTADNVALMGRDVGVIGAIIPLPLIPAGVLKFAA